MFNLDEGLRLKVASLANGAAPLTQRWVSRKSFVWSPPSLPFLLQVLEWPDTATLGLGKKLWSPVCCNKVKLSP